MKVTSVYARVRVCLFAAAAVLLISSPLYSWTGVIHLSVLDK